MNTMTTTNNITGAGSGTSQAPLRIGWIGLGSMGLAMATNVHAYLQSQSQSQPLLIYNRTPSRGDGLEALGAERCRSVAELAQKSDVVFISASDDAAVEDIVGQIITSSTSTSLESELETGPNFTTAEPPTEEGMVDLGGEEDKDEDRSSKIPPESQSKSKSKRKIKIILDTTTIHPLTTRRIAHALSSLSPSLSQKNQDQNENTQFHFAAIPVFGATPVAQQGKLLVAYAGPGEGVYDVVAPIIRGSFARDILRVGGDGEQEKASLLKTTGNFIVAGLMEIIAESHALAEKSGLSSSVLEKLLELNFGPLAHSSSVRMTSGLYIPPAPAAPWSDLHLAIKDVGHAVDIARTAGVSLKVGETALDHLERAREFAAVGEKEGGGKKIKLDSSALYGVVRQDSGLDFRTDLVKMRDSEER